MRVFSIIRDFEGIGVSRGHVVTSETLGQWEMRDFRRESGYCAGNLKYDLKSKDFNKYWKEFLIIFVRQFTVFRIIVYKTC